MRPQKTIRVESLSAAELKRRIAAAADKIQKIKESGRLDSLPQEESVIKQPLAPVFVTSVGPNGQVVLHLDQKTKIYLKPGHDPETVLNKYKNRDVDRISEKN